jgi:hypothetical protein
MSGKGSAQRPRSIADDEWAQRWDAIFGRDRMTGIAEKAMQERALDETKLRLYDDEMVKPNTDQR